jgi:hypothetical protein
MAAKRKWTKEEDTVLAELVQSHGKQWGFISTHLPQRTAAQVAARWEKCLDPVIRKGPFTPEEDRLIINFVMQNGPRTWPQTMSILSHRSAKQCRERWFNHLDPTVIKTEWTAEEDELILRQVEARGPKWSAIAKFFPGRSDNAIKNRWNGSISKRVHSDEKGNKVLLPDPAKRKYRPRKRPLVAVPRQNATERSEPPAIEKPAKPPKVEIPLLPPSSNVSPTIPFAPFLLPTPVFPGTEGTILSPNSPTSGFQLASGGVGSPTRGSPFVLSPTKSGSENSFK